MSKYVFVYLNMYVYIYVYKDKKKRNICKPYIDWCCFYYFLRNSLVALLEALFARNVYRYICVYI